MTSLSSLAESGELKSPIRLWEILLILLAIGMIGFGWYLSTLPGTPVLDLVLGGNWHQSGKTAGKITILKGSAKRLKEHEPSFSSAELATDVFENDVIITDDNSTVSIDLGSEHGVLTIGSSSMVKIAFESRVLLGKVYYLPIVDVLAGEAVGKAPLILKKNNEENVVLPSKIKDPTQNLALESFAPELNSTFPAKWVTEPKEGYVAQIPFEFKVNQAFESIVPIEIRLEAKPDFLLKKEVRFAKGKAETVVEIFEPGKYTWKLADLQEGTFEVPKKIKEKISVNRPLIAGKTILSSRFTKEKIGFFNVRISWKKFPGAEDYELTLIENGKETTHKTDKTRVRLKDNEVFTGNIRYNVKAGLPGGFVTESGEKKVSFQFTPPEPVEPKDFTRLAYQTIDPQKRGLVFSWKKTLFTENYDIEISSDPDFKSVVSRERVSDNFYVHVHMQPGTYWWRVRSVSKGVASHFSKQKTFTIQ